MMDVSKTKSIIKLGANGYQRMCRRRTMLWMGILLAATLFLTVIPAAWATPNESALQQQTMPTVPTPPPPPPGPPGGGNPQIPPAPPPPPMPYGGFLYYYHYGYGWLPDSYYPGYTSGYYYRPPSNVYPSGYYYYYYYYYRPAYPPYGYYPGGMVYW